MAIIRFLSLLIHLCTNPKYLFITHTSYTHTHTHSLLLHFKCNCACRFSILSLTLSLFIFTTRPFLSTQIEAIHIKFHMPVGQITLLKTYLIKTNATKLNFRNGKCTDTQLHNITYILSLNIECDTIKSMKSKFKPNNMPIYRQS